MRRLRSAYLKHYEVREAQGDSYNADDETPVATILPDAPREVLTDFGLGTAG